jgi:hypothetical protein
MRAMPQPPPPDAPPLTVPKTERPFRPGEFSNRGDGEWTRIAPVAPEQAQSRPSAPPTPTSSPAQAQQSGPYAPIGAGPMQGPMFPSAPYAQPGYPPGAPGSEPYGMPGAPPMGVQSLPPGGFGSTTPQGGSPPKPPNTVDDLKAKWAQLSPPTRIAMILLPISMLLAVIITVFRHDAPQPLARPPQTPDGGAVAAEPGAAPTAPRVATNATAPMTWPKGVPCPPPNWPPNVPLPCVPDPNTPPPVAPLVVDPQPPQPTPAPPEPKDPKDRRKDKDAGAPQAPTVKTLERQAVDAVAAGNTAQAAQLYEELSRRDPNNRVYAEAARILRAKLDGGAP